MVDANNDPVCCYAVSSEECNGIPCPEETTTTESPTTAEPTTSSPTTAEPTTASPTTAEPTTAQPTEPVIIGVSSTTGEPCIWYVCVFLFLCIILCIHLRNYYIYLFCI